MIIYNVEDVKMPMIPKRKVNRWIRQVTALHDMKTGDISYIFCSDDKILEVNKEYLHHDYFTDIITFDYTENKVISGDIFISLDTVRSNAEKFGTAYENELYRVIIHGILHLCGLDDKAPGARAIMEKHENEALQLLNKME